MVQHWELSLSLRPSSFNVVFSPSRSHDVVPRAGFQKMFDRIFAAAAGAGLDSSSPVNPQELALVFIVLAQGTLFNIEMPNIDPSAEDWLHLWERALVKGNFFANNTIPAVQTLVRGKFSP